MIRRKEHETVEHQIRMYDYILEEQKVLLEILAARETLAAEFSARFASQGVEELVITGSGTSYHAALAVRRFLEIALKLRVRAEYPMAFKDQQDVYSPRTMVVGVSQGGQSQSTVDALRWAKERGALTAAISENGRAKVFECAELHILMECGPELSVAKTKGYQATMLILLLLGLGAARATGRLTPAEYDGFVGRITAVIRNFDRVIGAASQWVERMEPELAQSKRMIVVGYKNNVATALEGALKLLETLRFGVYGYDAEEFCHGIYNSVDKDTHIFYLATEGEYKEKMARLREVLGETTEHQYVISAPTEGRAPTQRDCCVEFLEDPYFSVLEYILPLQIIAAKVPYALGINPFFASDPEFHFKVGSKQRQSSGATR